MGQTNPSGFKSFDNSHQNNSILYGGINNKNNNFQNVIITGHNRSNSNAVGNTSGLMNARNNKMSLGQSQTQFMIQNHQDMSMVVGGSNPAKTRNSMGANKQYGGTVKVG